MAKKSKGKSKGGKKSRASPAKVLSIVGRVSGKQSSLQVKCKIMSGKDEGKIMRKNVLGPVRVGDILMVKNTEMEASKIRGGR